MEKCLISKLLVNVNSDMPYFRGMRFEFNGENNVRIKDMDSDTTSDIANMAPTGSRIINIDNCIFRHPVNQTPIYGDDFIAEAGNRIAVFKADSTKPARFAIVYPNYDITLSMGIYSSDYNNCHVYNDNEGELFMDFANLKVLNFTLFKNINIDDYLNKLSATPSQIKRVYLGMNTMTFSRLFAFYNIDLLNFVDSPVNGSIEGLVDGFRQVQAAAGVTIAGSISDVVIARSNITYNNQKISAGHYTLSWDSQNLTWERK
jgi:hypothetical protein